ncbi:dihydrodipicolinate synthase family protein [Oceanobacillus jeddahense]|uniref:dihydrodipicolinate synthase family protein n=1 Tax=Oceanobacillus jeddahense TaxID=1462527 RepID=UPI000595FB46|nr:dihydrodipicolinate synthase family protein [Oceanobacillus jeddahense]
MTEHLDKFKGVFPAFYACYDDNQKISQERNGQLVQFLTQKNVDGLYVGGSSGECIYQSLEERKLTLKYVKEFAKDNLTLIAHVGAPSTKDSVELAQYASNLGYDALSSIPPIYYGLPESSIYKYWMSIIKSTNLPFIIYNIPQTTGYSLSMELFSELVINRQVIGIKNSSLPSIDIERFKAAGGSDFIVFNGPDEQYISGRLMGADSGIGGTYGVMPELYVKAEQYISEENMEKAKKIQTDINDIIINLNSLSGNMYAIIKEVLRRRGVNIGGVREPLENISDSDVESTQEIKNQIDRTIKKYK